MSAAPKGFTAGPTLSPGPHFVAFEVARAGERFVCKRLSSRWLRDEAAWERLRREASLLAALGGRGAPVLADSGDDDRGPYLVMREIEWPTLAARASAGALSKNDAARAWLTRAAHAAFAALAEVHEASDGGGPLAVVHGDVRPENVAVAPDGSAAVLLDFGLAVWRDAPAQASPAFRGTLVYAPPEGARGEALDVRADLFSLAASLLHAASGVAPRAAASEAALLVAAAEQPLDAWVLAAQSAFAPGVARALAPCLAYQRDDRPSSAREVAARLVLEPRA